MRGFINSMKLIKAMLQWGVAVALAFIIVNFLCFFYERPPGWIDTPNGPSPSGWDPDSILVHGTEGYSVSRVDQNGYLNAPGVLGNSYILCMGSSHTQGKEISPAKRYTALLNDYYSKQDDTLAVYNIGSDGNSLPDLIRHFPAAIQAFPNASVVTIEVFKLDYSAERLENALQQSTYTEKSSVQSLKEDLTLKGKLKIKIKEAFPLLHLIKSKFETAAAEKQSNETAISETTKASDALEKAMFLLRSEFGGEILFIYHPTITIETDGSISCNYDSLWPAFQRACSNNDIQIVDMGPTFLHFYATEKKLPYGFPNTVPGSGHLNSNGHALIAEVLIQYFEGAMK